MATLLPKDVKGLPKHFYKKIYLGGCKKDARNMYFYNHYRTIQIKIFYLNFNRNVLQDKILIIQKT